MSTTTVWTASATTVTSAAAERPLEARTRIAADTPGVAWEILRVSRGTANARRTSFAREENHVVFDDRRDFRDGSSWSRGKHFLFGVLGLDVLVFDLFLFAVLVRAMSGVMFGVLLSHVRSEFGAIGGAAGFDFFGFFLGELRNFRDDGFLDFFGLLFVFFFVELRAADYGIGFRLFLRLFVFGLDETGGKRGDLILVQLNVIPGRFHMVNSRLLRNFRERASRRSFLNGIDSFSRRRRFYFGTGIRQKPAGQPAREPARNASARGSGRQISSCARRNFLDGRPFLVFFMLNNGNRSRRGDGLVAVLRQRFTRKNDLFLRDAGHGRH